MPELSKADRFRQLSTKDRIEVLSKLDDEGAAALMFDWDFWARPSQFAPAAFANYEKTYWLVKAGRGYGKTRVGVEQVRMWVQDNPIVNLVGPTSDDARDIMIEGESGILAKCPIGERPLYQSSKRRLVWPNGALSLIFTADEPERLRGKQHYKLWADELAAWRYAESWEQIQFGLRLGKHPQAIITTTPKPTKLVKELVNDPNCIVTHGKTYDNKQNLAPAFLKKIITKYEGTRLGRQEIEAELLEDNPNALWTHSLIEKYRIRQAQMVPLQRIVVGVDPAVTAKEDSNDTGIVAVGMDFNDPPHFYVLADNTIHETPDAWAKKVVWTVAQVNADRVVGEVNNGGDLVEANIRHQDPNIPYKSVRASRGKIVRAEPISALYEQGRVHHLGMFAELEDQMCDFDPILELQDSPDRMDALVWAITELAEMEVETIISHDADIISIAPELDEFDFQIARL